ncbi:YggT family protein [Erwinia persicina]|jgi:YggT family protein|uniref:YggT family protein n=2 Tax=Erwinia TaxID=551 RepID=A0ABV4EA35_9GAMM|nr:MULTISPECIES: YggT family protein [Erwinia]MCP1439733.1 YggT family protein [Erwinia persicina]MDN4629220.1 YggT family protein [Erwinia sp. PsM31]MDN8541674.1 YggT family protein [Erwinia sp. BC051422]
MLTLTFLVSTIINLYVKVLLLRIWMQWARCDFYNPFSQFIVKITQPVIRPMRRVIPSIGPLDTASLLLAYVLSVLLFTVMFTLQSSVFIFDPVFLYFGLVSLVKAAGVLVFWVIIIRSLMSWISQGRNPVDYVLIQLTEPLMAPVRRLIPAMGGIDFSAMAVILILYMLNYLGMDFVPGWAQL